jgi:protein XagA
MRIVVAALLGMLATSAQAGPWTLPDGRSQVIVKYEDIRADQAFDEGGERVALPGDRIDQSLGVFAEYGLTDRLTLQFKGDWQDGEDAFVGYNGRGPLEIGATWQLWRDDRTAVSVYGGYADGGDGRNAGYAAPGVGQSDWEARASIGRSFGEGGGWGPSRSFADVQVARRMRDGLPDETRADFTYGAHYGDDWLVLGQAFGGVTDGEGARWLSVETSIVRNIGNWSLQGGWRQSVAGRRTPVAKGPILALWRRF